MHIKFHDTYFPYTLDSAPQILHGGWEQGYNTRAGGSPQPRSWTVLSSRCSWKGCQAIVASSEGLETTSLQLWLSSVWLQKVRYLGQLLGLLGPVLIKFWTFWDCGAGGSICGVDARHTP